MKAMQLLEAALRRAKYLETTGVSIAKLDCLYVLSVSCETDDANVP